MGSRIATRLAAACGIVGLILTVLGGVMSGDFEGPVGGESTVITEFYRDVNYDAVLVAGMVLEVLGFLLLMAFVGYLARAVGGPSDTAQWASTVIVSSVTVATVLTISTIVGLGAAAFRTAHGGLGDDAYIVLSDLRFAAYWLSLPAWALVYLTAGTVMVQRRSYPVWLGWAGIVIGVGHFALPFLPASSWDIAVGVGGLWLLVTAALMLARLAAYSMPGSE